MDVPCQRIPQHERLSSCGEESSQGTSEKEGKGAIALKMTAIAYQGIKIRLAPR